MNQKTTQLNNLLQNNIVFGDLIPIVDVTATSSPTGETKHVQVGNLAIYLSDVISPTYSPYQVSNGLWFDENVVGNSSTTTCYSPFVSLGTASNAPHNFTLSVRASFPSSHSVVTSTPRIIFGVGPSPVNSAAQPNSAYIGQKNNDLIGSFNDPSYTVTATIPNFFINYADKTVHITLVNSSGYPTFYINGVAQPFILTSNVPTSSFLSGISSSYIMMTQGASTNNVACAIYDAQVWYRALNSSASLDAFFSGPKDDSTMLASYVSDNINYSQWLDAKNSYHLLLPNTGSTIMSPRKEFNLRFFATASGYLGDGTVRPILPQNYVMTSAVVSSSAKPLLSIGSTSATPITGSCGTGSFYNNRVPWTSASYGINELTLLTTGISHPDQTIYVNMASASYCAFDFQGYRTK